MAYRKTVSNEELFADVEQIIDGGGHIQLRVKGNSMRPFLRGDHDIVHLSPIDRAALRRHMVVLFRYRGRHILHRISQIDGNKLEMKGDGNYRMAEYTTRTEVSAYVDAIERNGRLIRYGSWRWQLLNAWSLGVKAARTFYHDCKKSMVGARNR